MQPPCQLASPWKKDCLDLFHQTFLLPPMQWLGSVISELQEFLALPEVLISLKVMSFLAFRKSMKTEKDRHRSLISSSNWRMR